MLDHHVTRLGKQHTASFLFVTWHTDNARSIPVTGFVSQSSYTGIG